mmetsp:Transcript_15819/g.35887  ORF Transcript_15819/g.35887 Transcript_15819/m.35887 type:complete len:287 (+) Transcript_15819:68-928(+)
MLLELQPRSREGYVVLYPRQFLRGPPQQHLNVLARVDVVLDLGRGVASQREDQPLEGRFVYPPAMLLEEDPAGFCEEVDVYAKALQDIHRLRARQHYVQFLGVDALVAVLIMLHSDVPEVLHPVCDTAHGLLLILNRCNCPDSLDEATAQHPHHCDICQKDKRQKHQTEHGILGVALSDHGHALASGEGSVQQQAPHPGCDGAEARLPEHGAFQCHSQHDGADIDQTDNKQKHDADGAHAEQDPAQDDHHLRDLANDPGHAQHPEEPHHPEDRKPAQAGGRSAAQH